MKAHPPFIDLVAPRTWRIVDTRYAYAEGGVRTGVFFVIEFSPPLEADGPWLEMVCQGTRVQERRYPYRNVVTVIVVHNFERDAITGFRPVSPDPASILGQDRDEYEVPEIDCPSGKEDVGN
jgi:hypothetical protein